MKAFFPAENPILLHIQQTFHRRLLTELQEIPEVDESERRRCRTSLRRSRKTLSTDLTKLPIIEGKRNSSLNTSHRRSPCPTSRPQTSRPNSAATKSVRKLKPAENANPRPPSKKQLTRVRSHSNKKIRRVSSNERKKVPSLSFSKDHCSSEDERSRSKLVVE